MNIKFHFNILLNGQLVSNDSIISSMLSYWLLLHEFCVHFSLLTFMNIYI